MNFNWIHNQRPCDYVQINGREHREKFCGALIQVSDEDRKYIIKEGGKFLVNYKNIEWEEFTIFDYGNKVTHRLRSKSYYFRKLSCNGMESGVYSNIDIENHYYYIYIYNHEEGEYEPGSGIQLSREVWKETQSLYDEDETVVYGKVEKDEFDNYYGVLEGDGCKTKKAY